MMLHIASAPGPGDQTEHQDVFTEAHQVGVRDSMRTYQHSPLTSLDIDRFIERTITNPAHSWTWNAGYLAGWLAGMASIEGCTDSSVAQVHHMESKGASLHLVEVIRS